MQRPPVLPAAKAIGGLGAGLDDVEHVGGVLWTGLNHWGAEGSPDEQKRVILDRLTRSATRDGGDSSRVAVAIHSILDEYLPAR